jgi:hypothetical protein
VAFERLVKRYGAYFRGWAQAFGEHEAGCEPSEPIRWLLGEDQVGVIAPPELMRPLRREVLNTRQGIPCLRLGRERLEIGPLRYSIPRCGNHPGMTALIQLLRSEQELHLYLTYHFMYPAGTRIVTFSHRRPLPLVYKEITPLQIRLV